MKERTFSERNGNSLFRRNPYISMWNKSEVDKAREATKQLHRKLVFWKEETGEKSESRMEGVK